MKIHMVEKNEGGWQSALSAATLKKLARKLGVEDIVADLFNP